MPDERFGLPWGRIRKWQRDGLRVAATDGCFDILHVGHLRMLRWAASQADRLVVLLPDDASVSASKPGRPFVPLRDRAELVAALDPVDAVGHYTQSDLASLYAELAPDVLVNSPEWQGRVTGQSEVEEAGGRVAFFPKAGDWSTTNLVSRIRSS